MWVRICDRIAEHPKFVTLDDAGWSLWLRGLAYCARYKTNGVLEPAIVRRLGAPRAVRELLRRKLWEHRPGGGYQVHDYLHYQPDDTGALPRSRLGNLRAQAGAKGAAVRHGARRSGTGTTLDLPLAKPGESGSLEGGKPPVLIRQNGGFSARPGFPCTRVPEREEQKPPKTALEPAAPAFAAMLDALKRGPK